jgi:hypothetical protein
MRHFFVATLLVTGVMLAGRSLGQVKTAAQRDVEDNIRVLKTSKNADDRKAAIKRLGELEGVRRGLAKEATSTIAEAVKDKNADVRAAAALALGILRYDAQGWVKDVAELINEGEKREGKINAAATLGQPGVAKYAGFAVEAMTSLRDKEAAKPDGKRDNDLIGTLNDSLEAIQLEALHLGPWYYIGPFSHENNLGFKKVFPPEKEIDFKKAYPGKNDTTARWQKGNFTDGEINNLALFDEKNNMFAVVYLYREIECDQPCDVSASFGSDDTLTVWLNGEKLVEQEVYRTAMPDQAKLTLKLRRGKNALLIKVCQSDADWAFYFRVTGVKTPGK